MTSDADSIWMDQYLYLHNAACKGKKQHRTRREAKQHRKEVGGVDTMDVYRCRFCGCYHIGHTERRTPENEHRIS